MQELIAPPEVLEPDGDDDVAEEVVTKNPMLNVYGSKGGARPPHLADVGGASGENGRPQPTADAAQPSTPDTNKTKLQTQMDQ